MVSNIKYIDDDILILGGSRICYSLQVIEDYYWYKSWVYLEIPELNNAYSTERITINEKSVLIMKCSLSAHQHSDITNAIRKYNLNKLINEC